jgi:hypothetical protein
VPLDSITKTAHCLIMKKTNVEIILQAILDSGKATKTGIVKTTGLKNRNILSRCSQLGYIETTGKKWSKNSVGVIIEMNVYQILQLGIARLAKLTTTRNAGQPIPRNSSKRVHIVIHKKNPPSLQANAVAVYTPDTIITVLPSRFKQDTYCIGDGERGYRGIAQ